MGFKIALDDFGTGYSSLAYLCNFKFDKIKIDRSFISSISKVDASRRIVQSVITLGRGLGIDIVAEGVETEIEAVMMTHFGCTELQGYYFSRPIDADQMVDFLSALSADTYRCASAGRDRLIQRDAHLGVCILGSRRGSLEPNFAGGRLVHRKASRRQFYAIAQWRMPTISGRNSIPKPIFNITTVSLTPTTIWSSAARWRR